MQPACGGPDPIHPIHEVMAGHKKNIHASASLQSPCSDLIQRLRWALSIGLHSGGFGVSSSDRLQP